MFYQPQFSIKRNAIVGVEALIRWRHPVRGMVSPARAWREQGLPGLIIG